jgi:hypothetical protein
MKTKIKPAAKAEILPYRLTLRGKIIASFATSGELEKAYDDFYNTRADVGTLTKEFPAEKPLRWYSKTSNRGSAHEQGLIISENTGDNITVSYDPKHAPLLAAAPELLAAGGTLLENFIPKEIAP